MRRARARGLAGAVLASALLLTGCAQSVDPIERLGKKAAEGVRPHRPALPTAYRHWGLTAPLPAPPHPAARTLALGTPPRVVDRVPTRDRVVFLTYDDGAGRDPRFADMVRELRLPVTLFLAAPGHGDPARLHRLGAGLQNGAPAGRRAEICGRQRHLTARLGTRPRLLRPLGGGYDPSALRAAADCGITALVLSRATLTPAGALTYTHGPHRLRPGDIVQIDSAPPLPDRTAAVLRGAQGEGLTPAHLEDYL
ncbi:polysaccharide deacetylase family protein [Streptomyces sp. LP11]|uniref:Polysaccharide deacetylase family protein n=1 Tax=Streptomyces pyxinicus TaxID=2970331 RepID=A0ABT2AVA4_9ACTN|nr:polysaccharide deacetylase family protein [Streptomyces sp. LP11]MCS0600172.1 polysaccharide deacetylase family protein [Streptomyces sp. LP11]